LRVLLALIIVASTASASAAPPRLLPGWSLYDRLCLACHGSHGDGRGPASPYTWGRPRELARGEYEWRSTPIGQPPTDDDLRTTIRFGASGTSMPAFDGVLGAAELAAVIDVIKAFEPKSFARAGKPIVLAPAKAHDAARGAKLWSELGCARCHGERGKGDGPSTAAMTEKPYDLTTDPLRRPRASDDANARWAAAAQSIATGMAGTSMPGYADQVPDADIWALADHVVALGARAERRDRSSLDAGEIAADRTTKIPTGTWPGVDEEEAQVFGSPIKPQGAPLVSLAPAEASLRSRQCGRCHAKQVREWQPSLHAAAASPGFAGQSAHGADAGNCARCHTPLAEQQAGAGFDAELQTEGVTCASCHVREWVRRGPPRVAASLLSAPGYPLVELALYERSDFCMPCHQLPPRLAVAGRPLLNTYKEWLEGPYMRRGVQCQSCHMPNREHQWLGVHDRDTFRQGIRLDAHAHRSAGVVTVVADLANIGAGHYLPTTPTPAAWLRIELVDARGDLIPGASSQLRIGRDIYSDRDGWHERADTRIPPGDTRSMARAWTAGRTAEATAARVTVEVHPDDYYERIYAQRLATKLAPDARAQYERAAARAKASHYVADQQDVPIALSLQP
jgi:mono/diheme cytochrome c family protein